MTNFDEELKFFETLLDGSEESNKNLALILRIAIQRLDDLPQYHKDPILIRDYEEKEEEET